MKKIVIIEDDPNLQDALRIVFPPDEFEVTQFTSAEPIFADKYNIPALFILDKQLSGVNGLEVCRYLKSQEETKAIPVLMLSASPHITRLAEDAGADAALEKPFALKDLNELVERLIREYLSRSL